MKENIFLRNYFTEFSILVKPNEKNIQQLQLIAGLIKKSKKHKKKTLIFGNGGSAAIASHFSVDLTKNAGYKCMNFNEYDLITCLSNDFGYEHWVEKAIDFYGCKGDIAIFISSSGSSKNMLNGVQAAKRKNCDAVITFTGFSSDNSLRKLGDINMWVDSMGYNMVENVHQVWLLSIVDLLIGKTEYSAVPK